MFNFIHRVVLFLFIFLLLICILTLLPATPRASESMLFSQLNKDELLLKTPKPRLIIIGGSNSSFSLNSELIRDSLHLNPINTGVHVNIGLLYMINNTRKFVQEGDIIILTPEYGQFYGKIAFGQEELIRTIFEVKRGTFINLSFEHLLKVSHLIPKYALSKLKINEYFYNKQNSQYLHDNLVYSKDSYNKFGDSYNHWTLPNRKFKPYGKIEGEFNEYLIQHLLLFKLFCEKKKAKLIITFPAYQKESFSNTFSEIKYIQSRLIKEKFSIIGAPELLMVPDSLIFDAPYHLNKTGVEYRTQLLIQHYKYGLE
jgi:hypothetical protein